MAFGYIFCNLTEFVGITSNENNSFRLGGGEGRDKALELLAYGKREFLFRNSFSESNLQNIEHAPLRLDLGLPQ